MSALIQKRGSTPNTEAIKGVNVFGTSGKTSWFVPVMARDDNLVAERIDDLAIFSFTKVAAARSSSGRT